MRKLVESTYVSLDGMVAGDSFWGAQMQFQGDEHAAHAAKLLGPADALVLGKKTYEVFAESWPDREGDIADRLNEMPKYVASRTLTDATWNSEVLEGGVVEAVARLKEGGDGTLLKYGTGPVSQALIEGGQAGRAAPVAVPVHRRFRRESAARDHDHPPGPGRGDRGRQRRRGADLHAEELASQPARLSQRTSPSTTSSVGVSPIARATAMDAWCSGCTCATTTSMPWSRSHCTSACADSTA